MGNGVAIPGIDGDEIQAAIADLESVQKFVTDAEQKKIYSSSVQKLMDANRELQSQNKKLDIENKKLKKQLSAHGGTKDGDYMIAKQAALVFDCGTNETKAIFLRYEDGEITVAEMGKAPAVLTFLQYPNPTPVEKTVQWHKEVEKCKKKGKPLPKLCKLFLNDRPEVKDTYTLTPEDFLAFVQEQRHTHDGIVNTVMVGSSAWRRHAKDYGVHTTAETLVQKLKGHQTVCQDLSHATEGVYEATSVAYAVSKLDPTMQIDGVLGSGGGSVQYMHRMKHFIGLDCGFSAARHEMIKVHDDAIQAGKSPEEAVNAAIEMVDGFAFGEPSKEPNDELQGKMTSELKKAIKKARIRDPTFVSGLDSVWLDGGVVVCMSACYYAAAAAGLDTGKSDQMIKIKLDEVLAAFKAKIEELEAQARSDWAAFVREAKILVNLKLQSRLLETLFSSTTHLIFKREWKLSDKGSFRSTWTSGWFIDFLRGLNVVVPDPVERVLDILDEDGDHQPKTSHEVSLALDHKSLEDIRVEYYKDQDIKGTRTIVFDCETDTKVLDVKLVNKDGKDMVLMREAARAPRLLDFLNSQEIAKTRSFKILYKKHGRQLYFMHEDSSSSAEVQSSLNPGMFEKFADEQLKDSDISKDRDAKCIITHGSHLLEGDFMSRKNASKLFEALAAKGITRKPFNNLEKAAFKAAAVAYAVKCLKPDMEINGVLGSSDIGVQYVHNMDFVVDLDCGFEPGKVAVEKEYRKIYALEDPNKDPVEAALQLARDFVHHQTPSKTIKPGCSLVTYEINEKCLKLCQKFGLANLKLKGGRVVCVASCFFAARDCGICNAPDELSEISQKEMVVKLKAKIEELETLARAGWDSFLLGDYDSSTDVNGLTSLLNLQMQVRLFETFFSEDTMLIFKRDWKLLKSSKEKWDFRTTATAGWFLYKLQKQGMYFSGSEKPLRIVDNNRGFSERGLVLEEEERNRRKRRAKLLLQVEDSLPSLNKTAAAMSNLITPLLKKVEHKCEGLMKGLDFKIKTVKSMARKIRGEVVEMYAQSTDRDWHPSVKKCMMSIRDSLRYTILLPAGSYTWGVKEVEAILFDGLGKEFSFEGIAKKILFKNFWNDDDSNTTYMGINALVWCKEQKGIANSENYVFELQLHTPASFKLKNNESHLYYEAYRDPKVVEGFIPPVKKGESEPRGKTKWKGTAYKKVLKQSMLSMWDIHYIAGKKKFEGEIYNGVEYRPFKPSDMSIVSYKGRATARNRKDWEGKNYRGFYYQSKWENRVKE